MSPVSRATPTFSVVVCAYTLDRWDALKLAIESLLKQTLTPREIIVVSDHNPRLLTWVRAAFPTVTALANDGQQGLSGARNTGIAAASGDIVAFLDDDAAAAPDWLAQLASGYADPRVLGVGGRIDPRWAAPAPAWFPAEFYWILGCDYVGLPTEARPIRNLIGANMSIRRASFAQIGGFRSGMGRLGTIPLGCEETEFCIRLGQRFPDAILRYEPRARVTHLVTETRARPRYFFSRCWAEGQSKAIVTALTGTGAGLASERAYTFTILPRGVLRGLRDGFLRGDGAGFARAAAIVAGLAVTVGGYLRGTVGLRTRQLVLPTAPALPAISQSFTLEEAG
ncbi:MAG TPA: glycosyltransferase family 2 protein [Thermomicrobiales bacterium]|jgi:glycosyltransferase involved in cell wall biosynthesis